MINSVKAVETIINDEKRYVLIDIETGEIIDDAQGYGFHTPQKAYASYSYKLKQNGRKTYNKKDFKKWIGEDKSHAKFIKNVSKSIDDSIYYDEEMSSKEIKRIVKNVVHEKMQQCEMDLPFSETDLINFLGF